MFNVCILWWGFKCMRFFISFRNQLFHLWQASVMFGVYFKLSWIKTIINKIFAFALLHTCKFFDLSLLYWHFIKRCNFRNVWFFTFKPSFVKTVYTCLTAYALYILCNFSLFSKLKRQCFLLNIVRMRNLNKCHNNLPLTTC